MRISLKHNIQHKRRIIIGETTRYCGWNAPGVLVAISIPIFTTQLEKAREAVDISNMRAAYAVAQTDILAEDYSGFSGSAAGGYTGYYDVKSSTITSQVPNEKYGKSTVSGKQTTPDFPGNATFDFNGQEKNKVIKVEITIAEGKDPVAKISWVN